MTLRYPSYESLHSACFPGAAGYAALFAESDGTVRETQAVPAGFSYSERHLQCVWADPAWRPSELVTRDGERVVVEHPGQWNLEAGPDFLGAALRVGPEQRRITGDVEIHIHPSGWKAHGHHRDPRYNGVCAHVTWFPGSLTAPNLPEHTLQIALKPSLETRPAFSFDLIDVTAYPYTVWTGEDGAPPVLKAWTPDERGALLEAAGEERLRRKAERFREAMRDRGAAQTLYEEIMTALGYKQNKASFRTLARAVPVDRLAGEAGGDALAAYAILAGVSGLLPDQPSTRWEPEARAFFRSVWDEWWKRRQAWECVLMDRNAWTLSGLRPANRPLRRIMAAAQLFQGGADLPGRMETWTTAPSDVLMERMTGWLLDLPASFWSRHYSFSGKTTKTPVALVGESRAASILVNILVPFFAALQPDAPPHPDWLRDLPVEPLNQVIKQAAHTLFGPDHSESLYKTGLRRQGLIQIFHDFLLVHPETEGRKALGRFLNRIR